MSNKKYLAAVALALAGGLSSGLAQAHDGPDVRWSVTIGSPRGGHHPRAVPVPVYPAYPAPPVAVYPAYPPVAWERAEYHPPRWDRDGDGIPNRYDREYSPRNPRWDRDGDGVPNWRDHHHGRWCHDRHR